MGKKRVGILGGTFDPPHLGHLLLAETIREDFELDEVLFIPSNEPPHKDRSDLTAAAHRYAMVVAATLHNPAFSPSAVEVNRAGKSYSVETVRSLEEQLGAETEMFFVAGLDSFLQIQTWKSFEELLDLCHFVVVARPGNRFERVLEVLPKRFHPRVIDARGRGADRAEVDASERSADRAEVDGNESSADSANGDAGDTGSDGAPWRIHLSDAVFLDVSATEIRARVRAGRSIRYRVTPEVERYVQSHGLYEQAVVAGEAVT